MSEKTSGVFNLQERRAEHLIGTALSGVGEDGNAFVRFTVYPKKGVFWTASARALEIRSDVASDVVGLIHILLATIAWLGGPEIAFPRSRGTQLAVRAAGPIQDRILECRFDEAESFKLTEEPDGLCVLDFSPRLAEQLAAGLASELGRIAAWLPDE